MTLSDLKDALKTGVNRQDKENLYKDAINRARKYVMQRKSFTFMQAFNTITMQVGVQSYSLFDDFKELQKGYSPVTFNLNDGSNRIVPCKVLKKNEATRLYTKSSYGYPFSPYWCSFYGRAYVWIDYTTGYPTINIVSAVNPTDGPIVFNIDYYRYLPDLEKDSDDDEFTRTYPDMIINKAKAILFELLNDPQAATSEALFDKYYREASAKDAYQELSGLQNLM